MGDRFLRSAWRGALLLLRVVALLGGVAACADLGLEQEAWRCETDDDCLWGRVCANGGCRVAEAPPPEDTVAPPTCEDGDCWPGQTEREACGDCGTRERGCVDECAWGEWGACEDEGECTPGDAGPGPCGACGTQPRLCDESCTWQPAGECAETGVCLAGAEETLPCERCGVRRRACSATCDWGPWGLCEEQGPCAISDLESEPCGDCGTRGRVCDAECLWSDWGACTDEGECAPETQDQETCGRCGTRERACQETCEWAPWSACESEGECAAAEVETEACGDCGVRRRLCSDDCAWGDWGDCEDEGECEALTEMGVPCSECGVRTRSCTTACHWTPWSECAGEPLCGDGEACAAHGVCTGRVIEVPAVAAFAMGGLDGEPDEQPEHDVSVPAFAIDRLEVTVGEFAVFLGVNGNRDESDNELLDADDPDAPIESTGGLWVPKLTCQREIAGTADRSCADHPIFEVTWYGAAAYCAWKGGRLPSEAEWERAAAGAGDLLYPWGGLAPGTTRANCAETACADGFVAAAPVGSFPAGAASLGVEDLAGNVLEWVADWYHPSYVGAPTDEGPWIDPPSSQRVARGGHWTSFSDDLRATRRFAFAPSQTPDTAIGFRCAYDR